ncbi:MAG: glutamate--tRNA ligase [Syntrophaceticus sp.]|nr:glutamate--tRNA ligase [Syntrophaceticus sp.]MDD3315638.1 glutamate--tRNA ligase [Syntrophaceticus sp.]MDD4360337.1 glutamate--tRNA ligase [Syntrophaceticus sp.]MDD4782912.1 glutamate--tRNA ligase [Syntrophaceticus sp.]
MDKEIRVRFAPSPTGNLHIGGARTALFNWLFARHNGGSLILRIDDTDRERSTEESTRGILSALRWLGLDWDEGPDAGGSYGPYYQSQRSEFYTEASQELLEQGMAYKCYCTADELADRRKQARAEGKAPRYDGRCRELTAQERAEKESEGYRSVLRLCVPDTGETKVPDLLRGDVAFNNDVLDDFIIMKSDGTPTYNFACVIDDAKMHISHIIRAEEHLSNTPKQILIYKALGYPLPVFAHVSMILAPDHSKLSKRHGATSVEEFRALGYLPEALINYLALLGWSPEGEEEILSLSELVRQFSMERVGKTAAIYDVKKLTWMNGHYLNKKDMDDVIDLVIPYFQERNLIPQQLNTEEMAYLRQVVGAVRTRVKTLAEVADASEYFYKDDFSYEEKGVRKHFRKENAAEYLKKASEKLADIEEFDLETTENAYRELSEELGVKAGAIIHPTRMALSGRTMGPGLFDIMVILGKDKTMERLNRAIDFISSLDEM